MMVYIIICVKVDISSKEFCTRKYFQENSSGNINDGIYRPHLVKSIVTVNLQVILFQESCK